MTNAITNIENTMMTDANTLMWFEFRQNNSGGAFVVDESVAQYVYIQAPTADAANERAKNVGIYFDGTGDCPCCGNRWYETDDESDAVSDIDEITAYRWPDRYVSWTRSTEVPQASLARTRDIDRAVFYFADGSVMYGVLNVQG
jgi:hypothetical protein